MVTKRTKKEIKKAVKMTTKSISIKKAFSKSEIVRSIAKAVGLNKRQVISVIDEFTHIIEAHLAKKGPGIFVFPGIAKFRVIKKPATKARKGKNPFTGEVMTFAARPARNIVKIRSLKRLKDAVK